ncbi:TPA: exonuclease, partial [Klebsiella pneumoniae]|nr:exonuclease [Klebsiella pneumoniae]
RGLSGGEKRKVRLACALALQDMVANRASKSIQLFIGDEIDDALDSAGLERLMGILEAKARERGTVMIVSHKEMKSWFRETVTLEIKEGRSYVV